MTLSTAPIAAVRFTLYGSMHPASVAADHVARALTVPMKAYRGRLRGTYHRWTGSDAADVLVQANVPDEEGCPVERCHPTYPTLVYVTALDDDSHDALARVGGLRLLESEVLRLASSHPSADATCR